jgi:surface polysaccharide O-acyltransferase-like enzyme
VANPPARTVAWLDLARIGGAAAVVLIHVCAPAVVGFGHVGMGLWWLADGLDALVRWCVPLFVMISGTLLLDPRRPDRSPGDFLQRRASRILIPLLAWSVIYFAWVKYMQHEPVGLRYMLIGWLSGVPYSHLYFLYLIFGLYLITPMLRVYVRHASRDNAAYCLILLFALSAVHLVVATWWDLGASQNLVTQALPYIGYYLAGYYLKDIELSAQARRIALGGIGLIAALMTVSTYYLVARYGVDKGIYLYAYTSVAVIPLSLLVFLWLRGSLTRLAERPAVQQRMGLVRRLSAAAFGIYLIHPLVLGTMKNWWGLSALAWPPFGLALTFVADLLISTVLILALQRVPGLRRIVP